MGGLQTVALACLQTMVNGEEIINMTIGDDPSSQFTAQKQTFSQLAKPTEQQVSSNAEKVIHHSRPSVDVIYKAWIV